MEPSDIIGAAGVTLIRDEPSIAFIANGAGRMQRTDRTYLILNLIGAALACASSAMIGFIPSAARPL
jgi:hypothetical protein